MTDRLDSQAFDLLEGGQKLDLFSKESVQPLSSEEIWSTGVVGGPDTEASGLTSSEKVHLGLSTAGVLPGGIVADLANIVLYAKEGDAKGMAWSTLEAMPIIGSVGYFSKYLKGIKEGTEKYFKTLIKASKHEQIMQTYKIMRVTEKSGDAGPLISQYNKIANNMSMDMRIMIKAKRTGNPIKGDLDIKTAQLADTIDEQLNYLHKQITKLAPDYFNLRRSAHLHHNDLVDIVNIYVKKNPIVKRMVSDKKVRSVLDNMIEEDLVPKIGEGLVRGIDQVNVPGMANRSADQWKSVIGKEFPKK